MKVLWRVAQVLFGILFALTIILILAGVIAKSNVAIICGVFLAVIALTLCTLMGKAAKAAPTVDPRSEFDISIETTFKDGSQVLSPNCYCLLCIKNGQIQMKPMLMQPPVATLNLSQITNIGVFTETEIIEKSRNVVRRGIAGGILFGSVGAIVGGLSGTKGKQHKTAHRFIVINYIPNGEDNIVAMTFEEVNPFNKTSDFITMVRAGQTQKTVSL